MSANIEIKREERMKDPTAFDTDVLVIGGGFGGLATAIRIKELSPETSVLLVDKQMWTKNWKGFGRVAEGEFPSATPGLDNPRQQNLK